MESGGANGEDGELRGRALLKVVGSALGHRTGNRYPCVRAAGMVRPGRAPSTTPAVSVGPMSVLCPGGNDGPCTRPIRYTIIRSAMSAARSVSPSVPASHPGGLAFRWYRKIEDIAGPWRLCFGDQDVLRSYELHLAVERSNLPDVELHYLVGEDSGGVCCVVPCYVGRASLLTLANPVLQALVDGIRRVFRGFLWVDLFVVGSPVSTCGNVLGFRKFEDSRRWDAAAVTAVFDEVFRQARRLNTGLIVVKELEPHLADSLKARLRRPLLYVPSLPTTYLAVAPKEKGGYVDSICSKYRNKLKKRKAVAAASGIAWEVVPDCRGLEAEVFDLYRQVLENSDFVFERANREFFSRVCEALGDKAFFVMGFQGAGAGRKLVSFELVMHDGQRLQPFYSGFDYRVKQLTDIYFNVFYALIEEAERRGLPEVHLCQTAYEVKAELGATCHPLFFAVYHRRAWIRWGLRRVQGWLTPACKFPEREVFKIPPAPKKTRPAAGKPAA